MFIKSLPNSLPIRAWIAVIAISLIYLLSAVSSGVLAWVSEDDAKAINMAGSIRMATYRINYLLATDFENHELMDIAILDRKAVPLNELPEIAVATDLQWRLGLLNTYQRSFTNTNNQFDMDIDQQLQQINVQWTQYLKPALLSSDAQDFYQNSIRFVSDVDRLVTQLQYRNESRQQLQQNIQVLSLVLSMLIMFAGLWELRYKVLIPVERLKKANQEFKNGKHETRVNISGYAEFNALGESFNQMAETIRKYQTSLEDEVAMKTAHLTKANQVLSLLYDFAKYLTTHQVSIAELNRLITDFSKIIPDLEFTLCIQDELVDNKDSIAIHSNQLEELCSTTTCDNCIIKSSIYTKSYPVRKQNHHYGDIKVRPKNILSYNSVLKQNTITPLVKNKNQDKYSNTIKIPLKDEQKFDYDNINNLINENDDAITALTNLIATAMFLVQQRQQEHQIILLEERATIARELHDSLAQSLSYLKIQVSILEKRLQQSQCDNLNIGHIRDSIANIKNGLSAAYQQLRDLLVTFRLSLNEDGFDEALHNSADEFATKGNFKVHISNQVMSLNLTATEQVNLIQIIRESLSNISRHSQATMAEIALLYKQNTVILTIKDNGIGLVHGFDQTQHHGIMIMNERANSLGGRLFITPNTPRGTIIKASFVPIFLKNEY